MPPAQSDLIQSGFFCKRTKQSVSGTARVRRCDLPGCIPQNSCHPAHRPLFAPEIFFRTLLTPQSAAPRDLKLERKIQTPDRSAMFLSRSGTPVECRPPCLERSVGVAGIASQDAEETARIARPKEVSCPGADRFERRRTCVFWMCLSGITTSAERFHMPAVNDILPCRLASASAFLFKSSSERGRKCASPMRPRE